MKIQLKQANDFFFKFYNNKIRNVEILNFIDNKLYVYVIKEINKYNMVQNPKIDYNQFIQNLKIQVENQFSIELSFLTEKIIKSTK